MTSGQTLHPESAPPVEATLVPPGEEVPTHRLILSDGVEEERPARLPEGGTAGADPPAVESSLVEAPAVEAPAVEAPAVETPAAEVPAVETPAVETPAHSHLPPDAKTEETPVKETHGQGPIVALALAAMGVVFGDIGTSPLYTWNELRRHGGIEGREEVLGASSLLFWALTLIVTVKYVTFVLRADNHGEGGTFALMGILQPLRERSVVLLSVVLVFASSLLYGDGVLTPAISVLSAVEGLGVAQPALVGWVVPITLCILTGLFTLQRWGTAKVGRLFGPVMVVWFVVIAVLGLVQIVQMPAVLQAVNPLLAIQFIGSHGLGELAAVLGAAVLCITGGEALYADLGHFGHRAIRLAWLCLVYPCLVLNYLGQGAYLLSEEPVHNGNVFYSMVPDLLLYPMIGLATLATITASQALISGAFSLTRAAINLGLFPRVHIVHTSDQVEGQIYLPAVNTALWIGCCFLVIQFESTTRLAGAYGLSVSGDMLCTSVAMYFVARYLWGWKPWLAFPVFGFFSAIDLAFLLSNMPKFKDGGYVPVFIAVGMFTVMTTWRRGRAMLAAAYRSAERMELGTFLDVKAEVPELPRAMVFMSSDRLEALHDRVPLVLNRFLRRYGALPRHVTLFSVAYENDVPYYTKPRYEVHPFAENVVSVRMHVGYMESPNVRTALHELRVTRQIRLHAARWTIVMGHEQIIVVGGPPLVRLQFLFFQTLMRFATQAHVYFGLGDDPGVSKEVVPVRVVRGQGTVITDEGVI